MGLSPSCWGMWGPGYGIGGPFGMALTLLFGSAILAGGVYLFGALLRRRGPAPPPAAETALEVLKRRYAAGEIGSDDFARIKRDLA